jgi:putative toxin-antitoxin system antitoxin component (TIGR02293 family)
MAGQPNTRTGVPSSDVETRPLPPELLRIGNFVTAVDESPSNRADAGFARIDLIRRGLPLERLSEAAQRFGISEQLLADALHLSPPAEGKGNLNQEDSEKVLRAFDLFDLALEVFGPPDAVKGWFREPARGLGGRKPLELLDTGFGAAMVEEYLGAIQQGNYW